MAKILQIQMHPYDTDSDLCEKITIALHDQGHEVTVAFLKGEYDKKFTTVASRIKEFGFGKNSLTGFRRLFSIYRILSFCKAEGFDVVFGHRFKPIHMLMTLGFFIDSKMIGIIHGEGDYKRRYRKRLVRKRGAHISKFVAVSNSVNRHLLDLECGFDSSNTITINNSVDVERVISRMIPRKASREGLEVRDDAFLFGSIGRLVPVKGHRYLVDAFGKLAQSHPSAELLIIGEGRERENLEKQIVSLGINGRVHLVGWKDEPARYLASLDCYVFPSLNEGLPLGLLEGMCAGIPVIGSDIPAIQPILEGCGITTSVADSEALYHAMKKIIEATGKYRQSIGQESLAYVKRNFDIESFNASYQNLVSSLLR